MKNLFADLRSFRRVAVLAGTYSVIIAISFYLAYEVRFDFVVPAAYQNERLHYVWFVIGLKILALLLAGQFGSMMSYFSIPDLFRLSWATTGCSLLLFLLRLPSFIHYPPPRGVILVDYLFCLIGLCAVRLGVRVYRERITLSRRLVKGPHESIAIVGAGDAGASLASEFINAPSRGFKPVAFFDDDERKHGKMIHGIPVLGRPELLGKAGLASISKLIIAMPAAPAKRVREIVMLAAHHKIKVETIPSIEALASGRVRTSKLRPVEIEDLLGRESVNMDSGAIFRFIEGRVVMVTGAGGSIGSELCRQIAVLNPKRLLMVEQCEGSLFLIEQELNELGFGSVILPLAANILDRKRMEFIFSRYHPDAIFHAAAHKHVYLMERQPSEAVNNNVFGTRLLARCALDYKVSHFVLISTDKAINPTNVMGATKRLAEIELQAIQSLDRNGGTKFIAVRFGNVLGSSGSVIPIFKRQIAAGGPLTVTHPDVTRYFMTIPEAVGLVLQSAVMGKGGEIFVLDMGQPVKIVDLAHQMIELSGLRVGEDIEIKFVGLKPGEKLFEELRHQSETHIPTAHPRVMRFVNEVDFNALALDELEKSLYQLEPNEIKKRIQVMVPEYIPFMD